MSAIALATEEGRFAPVQNPSSLCAFAALREIFSVFVSFVSFPYC
jgi:hypothetical protein